MKKELKIFFTAVMFYTRIPCPSWVDHSDHYLNKATRYFPLIGWITGAISALVFITFNTFLEIYLAIIFSLSASVLTTGAFHEDGFADVCDGFGGGWTKGKILDIMKDSRVGAYGVIGLILLFATKIGLWIDVLRQWESDWAGIFLIFIGVHTTGRFVASTFIYTHEYARENGTGKSKPVAKSLALKDLVIGGVITLIPLLAFVVYSQNSFFLFCILTVYLSKILLGRYFKKWIGGYTGDCLGATQQVGEVVYLISFILIWKYTL